MTIAFQESEVDAAWASIFAQEKYDLKLTEIFSKYPEIRSIYVEYADIEAYNVDFGMFVLENPDYSFNRARSAIKNLLPPDWDMKQKVNFRITGLPRDAKVEVRHIRAKHLGKLIAVDGMVRKATTVKPRMTHALFRCARCGAEMWVEQPGMFIKEPLMCSNPEGSCNKTAVKFNIDAGASLYMDTQKVEIQESPEGLRGGAQPERLTGIIEDDITGLVTAGPRVTLNGIVRSTEKQEREKSTVFEVYLDVISIEYEQREYEELQITEEDEEKILEISKDPMLFDHIVASIAPTIYGMEREKAAIALQLFGGSRKRLDDGTKVRGDIHIMLIGDPGVAKSQVLRYMSGLAPRGIFASGKSASAAGLTAAAVKDDFGDGRWTLEAGALVLADKGLACVDELDKMTDQDKSSLHEAMESQSISVAKAGITATLQCRCSLLAAANPKFGRFEIGTTSIAEQIDLPPALISRFDLIFVLTDKPESRRDSALSDFVLGVHRRGQALVLREEDRPPGVDTDKIMRDTESIKPFYEQEILRKYVAYSKRFVPILTDRALGILKECYLEYRERGGEKGQISITARQLEALVRLSEASAKMRLSMTVDEDDAKRAVALVSYCLQNMADSTGGEMDMSAMDSQVTRKERDFSRIILGILKQYQGDNGAYLLDIQKCAEEEGVNSSQFKKTFEMLRTSGEIFEIRTNYFKVA